jgi:hypothetical protein
MKLLFHTANFYMILGLVSGLYYRELTHLTDFEGETRLSVVHTHLLALGMLFFLIALALEKVFALSESRLFKWSSSTTTRPGPPTPRSPASPESDTSC